MSRILKATLRKQMKYKIKQIPAESMAIQSSLVVNEVISSDEFKYAKGISLYLSTSTEVNTIEILEASFKQSKKVFVPSYSYPGNAMEMLQIRDLEDFDSLPLTKWEIKQPDLSNERENALEVDYPLDIFIIPGVAFTTRGERLGHGMGYYDKYLTKYFNNFDRNGTKLFGLAFNEQIVEELPTERHDFLLDKVIYSKLIPEGSV